MSDEHVEHPPPFGEIPEEFLSPEGEGELHDPALTLESRSGDMRMAWKDWFCGKGPGKFVDVKFFGSGLGGVPAPAEDAYKALESALQASGYPHGSSWSNVCRKIANSTNYSLHSYGIAIDIDAPQNPQSAGDPFSGRIQKNHVDAVLSIKNTAGQPIWSWGGYWSTPDRMHFQLDHGPTAVAVDWSTVPSGEPVEVPGITHRVTATTLNIRSRATTAGDKVASLPKGTQVAAQDDAPQEADEYRWIKIKAGYAGRLVEGWVADEFLETIAGAGTAASTADASAESAGAAATSSSDGPARIKKPTHRVDAAGLNMRRQPKLSGKLITELAEGTEVRVLSDAPQESDGYEWVEIRAVVGDGLRKGWVAQKYLKTL